METLTGIIQKDATVLAEDGTLHQLPIRGTDKEGYPEVLVDAKEVGGSGSFYRQSVKPFIGMTAEFVRNGNKFQGFNFIIIKE